MASVTDGVIARILLDSSMAVPPRSSRCFPQDGCSFLPLVPAIRVNKYSNQTHFGEYSSQNERSSFVLCEVGYHISIQKTRDLEVKNGIDI
jgi:hypothetical protein